MKKTKLVLCGAGARGADCYAPYVRKHAKELEFTAVAEIDEERRRKFGRLFNIPEKFQYRSWEDLLAGPRLGEGILICTQDKMHFQPAVRAVEKGYHILIEKPISPDPEECIKIGQLAEKSQKVVMICHVLRYTPFFIRMKALLQEGRIGRVVSIQHNENVGYWHYAHSFVRGAWRNSYESSPMILAKSCHDMDILLFMVGADCVRLSSFGSLMYFKKENQPAGAAERCLECRVEKDCPYSALKVYLNKPSNEWPVLTITNKAHRRAVFQALQEGPYGRCVFHCDNNVVDHQVVNMEFKNGITAAFTMSAFTHEISRTIKIMGTTGEIRGHLEKNELEIYDFNSEGIETIKAVETSGGHSGGDEGIMREFVSRIRGNGKKKSSTADDISVQSHLMAFAAEESRLTGKVIDMEKFTKTVQHKPV